MAVGVGDITRADVVTLFNSAITSQNTFQLRNVGVEVTELDALDDIVDILEALYQLIGAILSTIQIVQRVRVINLTDDSDVGIGNFTDTSPGTSTAGISAPQVAYGLNLVTAKLGNRGRKFFGPTVTPHVGTNGVLSATAITALSSAGSFMIVTRVGVHSSWEFGIRGTVDGVWRRFTGFGVTSTAVTQRRRRLGVGV